MTPPPDDDALDGDEEVGGGSEAPDDRDSSEASGGRDSSETPNRPDTGEVETSGSDRKRRQLDLSEPPTGTASGGDEQDPFLKEVAISILAVLLVGAYIFMISGVWPPMVAVESGSMEPNMNVNDLVFVMDDDRFQPDEAASETGVVTAERGEQTGYRQFGGPGDVIVFTPNGADDQTPIIHRAMFWVEEGENWTTRADPEYLSGEASCEAIQACPAPHDGFITKGDNNPSYDQAGGGSYQSGPARVGQLDPVKPEWVVGTAEVRIPGIGWLRLRFQ